VSAPEDGPALVCVDCGAPYTVPRRRRQELRERGLPPPARCDACRDARRAERNAHRAAAYETLGAVAGHGAARAPGGESGRLYPAVCDACGGDTRVPFRPREGRPVYCRACDAQRRGR
jgi:CxxC-x17-CxxC domain-containing protein